jgi:glycosyltransferase involved in cell wall biosynthesis
MLEAMACGLPVITTSVGLANDLIKDGENGLFINWDPIDMAEKILLLLSGQELQRKFSQAGMEIVKQFERKTAIKNYAEKLQSILEVSGGRP